MARKKEETSEASSFEHTALPIGQIACGQESAGGNVKIGKRDFGETKADEPKLVDSHGNPA